MTTYPIVAPTEGTDLDPAWGEDVTDSLNDHQTRISAVEVPPLWALKTSDETVNNSSTLQDDDALFVSAVANSTYLLELFIIQNSNSTANFKLDVTLPAGATWRPGHFDCANTQVGIMATAALSGVNGAGADSPIRIFAVVQISSTAGTVRLRWAQNTTNASNTTVKTGSWLALTKKA